MYTHMYCHTDYHCAYTVYYFLHMLKVELFNGVARNGYKFVYLSARPIGYAGPTRSYLKWIRQGNQSLPDGPLLVAPLSVLKAFTKCVFYVSLYVCV